MKTVKVIIAIFTVFFIFFLPVFLMPKNKKNNLVKNEKKEFITLDFQDTTKFKSDPIELANPKKNLPNPIKNSLISLPKLPVPLITAAGISEKFVKFSNLEAAERITKIVSPKLIEKVPQKITEVTENIIQIPDVFDVNDVDEKPQILKNVPPLFPYRARLHNIKGSVTVHFKILANGSTSEITKISEEPSDYQLFNAAKDALKNWTFSPARKDGRAVTVAREVTFIFEIN